MIELHTQARQLVPISPEHALHLKTLPCKMLFSSGICNNHTYYEGGCPFAHTAEELNPTGTIVCKYFALGTCTNHLFFATGCPFVHTEESLKRPLETRHSGTISAYYPEKGFGFIKCPEVHALFGFDVFVHQKHIGSFNIGDQVTFTVTTNKHGKPQASDLQSMVHVPAPPVQEQSQKRMREDIAHVGPVQEQVDTRLTPETAELRNEKYVGVIKEIAKDSSYGAIFCKKVKDAYNVDVYCPGEYLHGLKAWNTVVFDLAVNEEGRIQALNVQPPPVGQGSAKNQSPAQTASNEAAQVYQGTIKSLNYADDLGLVSCNDVDVAVAATEIAGRSIGETVAFQIGVTETGQTRAFLVTVTDGIGLGMQL